MKSLSLPHTCVVTLWPKAYWEGNNHFLLYLTLRSVSSLSNPHNSEMKFCALTEVFSVCVRGQCTLPSGYTGNSSAGALQGAYTAEIRVKFGLPHPNLHTWVSRWAPLKAFQVVELYAKMWMKLYNVLLLCFWYRVSIWLAKGSYYGVTERAEGC
jgi:hypothetical protein